MRHEALDGVRVAREQRGRQAVARLVPPLVVQPVGARGLHIALAKSQLSTDARMVAQRDAPVAGV